MTAGADPIAEIMSAIVAIADDIDPPTGFNKPLMWDNLTSNPGGYPAWLHVPDTLDSIVRASGTRTGRRIVNSYLLFNAQEYNYASSEQRQWEPLVLDAFDNNLKLSSTVQLAEIVSVSYAPIEINGVPFVALTFRFEIIVSEGYEFSA